MKKLIILLIISFSITFSSKSQEIKYKDVYDLVLSGDKEKSYTMLLAYQKQDPNFANTYFQMGLITMDWQKSYNPFTDYYFVKLFIYNTKLYFNLARHTMQEESKSNYKYYENAGIIPAKGKLADTDINNFIDKKVAETANFEIHINKIINSYNKTVESYNKCIAIFKEINSEFAIIKNIYLNENKDFIDKIDALEIYYDSTLIYFDKYKIALKEYPIGNYHQEYKLRKIVTYRLDGLTSANFLENDINLWDYKTWVKEVKQTMNTTIRANKTDIDKTYSDIKNKIDQFTEEKYSDEIPVFTVDKKIIYKIGKYDNNSLLVRLFNYFEAKVNLMILERKTINNPLDKTFVNDKKIAQFYKSILDQKQFADSLNKEFETEIKPEQIRKYQNFYLTYFEGMTGLKQFSFQQELFLNTEIEKAFSNYLKKIVSQSYFDKEKITFDSLKNININFNNPFPEEIKTNNFYVTNYLKTDKNNILYTGFYKNTNEKMQSFFGKANENGKNKFLTKLSKSDTSNVSGMLILPIETGFYILQTSQSDKNLTNILTKTDLKGILISEQKININLTPKYAQYDDIANSMIIVFEQNINKLNLNEENKQIIYSINLNDNTINYKTEINLKGEFFGLIKVEKNIFIFNNFNDYTDIKGKTIKTIQENATNIFLSILDETGKITEQKNYLSDTPFFGIKAIKINSKTINIIGCNSILQKLTSQQKMKQKPFYSIIDEKGNEIFNNRHD